jgi:hypothetical protein
VADHGTLGIRDERDGELSGLAQCVDDGLLGVARVWSVQKRGNRYRLNCSNIGSSLVPDHDVHWIIFSDLRK